MSVMDWTPLKTVIDENESFLISSHVRPDADALGSELGMRAILLAMGKKVTIVNASAPPANLQFMNPPGVILKLNDTVTKATIPQHDVVIIRQHVEARVVFLSQPSSQPEVLLQKLPCGNDIIDGQIKVVERHQ